MTNELTKFLGGGDLAQLDTDAIVAGLDRDASDSSGRGGDFTFLSFSGKRGSYAYGRGQEALDEDNSFLIIPLNSTTGWICWKGGKPVAKHEVSIFDPTGTLPAEEDLEDHVITRDEDGWARSRGFLMFDMSNRAQVKFSTSSISGNNVFANLNGEVATQMKLGEPWFPVVTLGAEEFTAQEYKNFKPVIEVLKWVTPEAAQAWTQDQLTTKQLLAGKQPKVAIAGKKGRNKAA